MSNVKKTKGISVISDAEVVKKGKYRVFNGAEYETIYLQTSAEQVIESELKKFVSETEKNVWNSKADGNHTHDTVYLKKGESYTIAQADNLLAEKSDAGHNHTASSIIVDTNHKFVTDAEKSRWSNTYIKTEVDDKVKVVSDAVISLESTNVTQHNDIIKGYQDGDKEVTKKVTKVQENLDEAVDELTKLINNGGTANTDLASRVNTIENTTIPAVKKSVTDLDTKLSKEITTLSEDKADTSQVTIDIAAAKTALQKDIDLKANKSYTDNQLGLKADKLTTYTKEEVNDALSSKVDSSTINIELSKKADKNAVTASLALKANATDVEDSLKLKANVTDLEEGLAKKAELAHKHSFSQIDGLGSAASKNVGTLKGNVPVLDDNGKLEISILPSIAINNTFTAKSPEEAMRLPMKAGDILILESSARQAAIDSQSKDEETLTYSVSNSTKTLSKEYTTYLASGRLTYLCINPSANTFEERFRPLQSSGDTISSAEVESKLASKLNISEFTSYQTEVKDSLDLKADKLTTYNKTQVDTELSKKVDKVPNKQLSTHDFNNTYKNKLDGIADNANNYVHPVEDGDLHVPATSTISNGRVLMAGSSAGSISWKKLNASNVDETNNKKFVTPQQIELWTNKADAGHDHDKYRLISDSYSQSQTRTEINKMRTIVNSTKPNSGVQVAGAVWIEIK